MRIEETIERLWPGRRAEVEPLGGGLTNHNFKVTLGGEVFVLRVGGKDTGLLGIDRRHEHGAGLVAAALGIGPEVVAFLEPEACLVTRFVDGDPIAPETIRSPAALGEVAGALRRLHDGPPVPGRFDAFRVVESYGDTVLARGRALPAAFADAKTIADRIERALGLRDPRPCHNDLLNANFVAGRDGLRIVDWEYAGMGDPFFDLANFSVNNGLAESDDRILLAAYDPAAGAPELARLALMRFMSDFREAMWGAVQKAVSELDVDFAAYADEHFQRLVSTAESARFRDALDYVTQRQLSQ